MADIIFFSVALFIFVIFLTIAIVRSLAHHKKSSVLKPVNFLIVGTFLSCTVMFLPVYSYFFSQGITAKSVILSVHNSIRLFVVDADFQLVAEYASMLPDLLQTAYQTFFAILYCIAPILTFGFILSLFKNLSAYFKLIRCFFKDVYVFSDLNERSLALANDLHSKDKRVAIVFADVFVYKDETNEYIESAEEIGAIIFQKSVLAINLSLHSKKKKLVFFAISDNEEENVSTSSQLFEKYKNRKETMLYIFSMSKQCDLFLDSIDKGCPMKIRRVTESFALIKEYLYNNGKVIFQTANLPVETNGNKVISAVVVGLGAYGMEMAKALPWYCQMQGYHFKMNVFDMDTKAESRFRAQCPDFLNPAVNRVYVEGEAQHDITVHSGVDCRGYDFEQKLNDIKDVSFVFIALGSDEENIRCAVTARMYFERMGIRPHITAVVYDKDKSDRIKDAQSNDHKPFDIEYTGSLKEIYSAGVIINSVLEDKALAVHMKYPATDKTEEEHRATFYTNEYNYKSSCASAIHNKARIDCKIAGADKAEEDMTEEEREIISVIEHRRWNAYVRSYGYIYSGSPEKSSRNDLAKMHNCLIPYNELSDEYKAIDTMIGIKK